MFKPFKKLAKKGEAFEPKKEEKKEAKMKPKARAQSEAKELAGFMGGFGKSTFPPFVSAKKRKGKK